MDEVWRAVSSGGALHVANQEMYKSEGVSQHCLLKVSVCSYKPLLYGREGRVPCDGRAV